jgi:hypothetical protein
VPGDEIVSFGYNRGMNTSSPRVPVASVTVALALLVLLVCSGCLTIGRPAEPDWISAYPSMPGYYLGIGSSRTGDRGGDLELARAKAMVDLAASISTTISSEASFVVRETSGGESSAVAEVAIRESVDQHLREVETFDSYYSDEAGYWFLLRLSRATWERIQQEEIDRLVARVDDVVRNEIEPGDSSESAVISALGKAWELLAVSPWAGFVPGRLGGRDGLMIDLLEAELKRRIDSLELAFTPGAIIAEAGRPAPFALAVTSRLGSRPGSFTVRIVDPRRGEISAAVTDESGAYEGTIDAAALEVGKTTVRGEIDLERLGIRPEAIPGRISKPVGELAVDVRQIQAGLEISVAEGIELEGIEPAVTDLLSQLVPLKFGAPGAGDRFLVRVEITRRNAPASDLAQGLTFVYFQAAFTVRSDGKSIYSYRSEEYKGGGLDSSQAQDKAFDALMGALAADTDFAGGFSRILSLE